MDRSHNGTERKGGSKRPWSQDRVHTAVRLTAAESKMLKALVRHLRISQKSVLATALRELHETRLGHKAA
jgi:hypothetical protein